MNRQKKKIKEIERNSMEQSPSWKLIFTQLVKKFPAFYGTRKFITTFTRAHHWSVCGWRRRPQLQIYRKSSRKQPTRGGSPTWGLGEGITRRKIQLVRECYTRVYPKVSGLAAWSENSFLSLGAVVSLFCESV
jgi:hypothetical protein